MAPRITPSILLLTAFACAASIARAAEVAASDSGGVKSLVEKLQDEREARLDKSRVSPLGSWSTREIQKLRRKYLSREASSGSALQGWTASALALPGALSVSGERAQSPSESQAVLVPGARAAQKWNVNLDVPVTHFWGKATLSAGFERSQPGASREAQAASAPLQQNATVTLRQEVKKGVLSGSAELALAGADSRQDAPIALGERERNAKAEGSARLKLQLAPTLAITGSHQSRMEREASLQPVEPSGTVESEGSSGDALAQIGERQAGWDVERQALRRSNSELGLEWKMSKSLAISAGASATRSGQEAPAAGAGVWAPRWLRDESRANVSLQKRTGGGSWGLMWSRAWAEQESLADSQMKPAEDKRADALSLQAEHKLFGWLSMRGSWRLAGETNYLASRLSDQATREAEARISGGMGSLALRYSDWSSQSGALGSEALGGSGRREYGVRYEAGRAAGLGLAVEYSVRDERASNASENWKLGITYR